VTRGDGVGESLPVRWPRPSRRRCRADVAPGHPGGPGIRQATPKPGSAFCTQHWTIRSGRGSPVPRLMPPLRCHVRLPPTPRRRSRPRGLTRETEAARATSRGNRLAQRHAPPGLPPRQRATPGKAVGHRTAALTVDRTPRLPPIGSGWRTGLPPPPGTRRHRRPRRPPPCAALDPDPGDIDRLGADQRIAPFRPRVPRSSQFVLAVTIFLRLPSRFTIVFHSSSS